MSRFTLLRASAIALGAAALLAGCVAPAPVVTPSAEPTPDFGTIGGESPIPIETDTPVEPVEPQTSGFAPVLDDLGVLTVTVPDDWTDVNGIPFTTESGQEWASITVAPDIDAYLESWDVSGLEIAATAAQGTTEEQLRGLLDSITQIYSTCETAGAITPYDDGFFVGFETVFEGCGDGTVAFAITATDKAGTQGLFLRAQVTASTSA